MRDHDLELIAALVEGRIEDEAEARALIDASPEMREEYEAQAAAHEALSSVGTAALTPSERTALHRDLWTALRQTETPVAHHPWYTRWAPVAAGMFVVIGLVAVLNQAGSLGGGDAATAEFTVTTIAGATQGDDTGDPESDRGGDGGGEAAPLAPSGGSVDEPAAEDVTRTLSASEEAFYAAEAEKVRAGDSDAVVLDELETDTPLTLLLQCLEDAGLEGFTVVGAEPQPMVAEEGTVSTVEIPADIAPFIAAIPEGADLESALIAFVDLFDCELIHVDE